MEFGDFVEGMIDAVKKVDKEFKAFCKDEKELSVSEQDMVMGMFCVDLVNETEGSLREMTKAIRGTEIFKSFELLRPAMRKAPMIQDAVKRLKVRLDKVSKEECGANYKLPQVMYVHQAVNATAKVIDDLDQQAKKDEFAQSLEGTINKIEAFMDFSSDEEIEALCAKLNDVFVKRKIGWTIIKD